MNPVTVTTIAAAVVTVITAITALLVVIREILPELRKNTAATVQGVKIGKQNHEMLNSQRVAAEAQQTRSDNAMREADVPLPFNPAAGVQVSGTEKAGQ